MATLATLAVLLSCVTAGAQPREIPWRKASKEIVIDYEKPPAPLSPTFTRDGFGLSMPFGLAIVGQGSVRVKARLTQPGRFAVELTSPDSQVEVKSVPGSDPDTAVDLVVTLPLLSEREASERAEREAYAVVESFRAQAVRDSKDHGGPRIRETLRRFGRNVPEKEPEQRKAYVPVRMCELGKEVLLEKVEEFAERHPTWVDLGTASQWPRSEGPVLHKYFQSLRLLDIKETHLRQWGFELDTTRANTDRLISSKFASLVSLISGSSSNAPDASKDVRPLAPEEQQRVRAALKVTGRVLFYPRTNAKDANSQWYNGQKLQCPSIGISVVRVKGSLHAGDGDVADWWTLRAFDPNKVRLHVPDQPGISWELFEQQDVSRLRIHARQDAPVEYWFELLPRSSPRQGREVQVHESPFLVPGRFPF